jgi:hypothetical protein
MPQGGKVCQDAGQAPGAQGGHVLKEHGAGPHLAEAGGDVEPQATSGSLLDSGALACQGEVLARPAGGDDVDWGHVRPVHGGDVAEIGHAFEADGQDLAAVPVGFGASGQLAAQHLHDGKVKPP